jgi:protoporphyrinogen oxidase
MSQSTHSPKSIAIIGAGAAGLAAAYDLAGAGHQVTVYEAAPNAGGLASGFKEPHWDWSIERFYHHWFQTDSSVLGLINEISASDKVLFPRPITAIYYQGQFYPFDSMFTNMPQFLLRHFPLIDVIRFGFAGAYLKFSSNWKSLESVTADQWMTHRMGKRVYESMWKPLLIGKFSEYYDQVNMAWMWARIHARTTRLGTFVGGFQAFFDTLAEAVRQRGASIQLASAVREIAPRAEGGVTLHTPFGAVDYAVCLVTTSPRLLTRLAPSLSPDYLAQLSHLKSMGAVVLILSLKHQLSESGIYWHNLVKEAGFPFLALCEHTNFVSPDHFGGDHLIYCGDYLSPDHEYFKLTQAELVDRFVPALSRFNPKFDRSWINKTWLFREPYAQPVPPINHSQNIPDIRTPIAGLYFASMSQVYPWDRGTNYAVEIGRRTAKMIASDLMQR